MIPISYNGAKGRFAAKIARLFPILDSSTPYIEPFVGTGAVTLEVLSRTKRRCMVHLNDANGELMNLWTAITWHHERFQSRLEGAIAGMVNPQPVDFIDRAVNFYLDHQKLARYKTSNVSLMVRNFEKVARLLENFQCLFTSMDAIELIKACGVYKPSGRWNGAVIYCDPPYINTEGYDHDVDHEALAAALRAAAAQGHHVFVSLNVCEKADELYSGWRKVPIKKLAGRADRGERYEVVYTPSLRLEV
jgi:site-specific DNA-adenine methylase